MVFDEASGETHQMDTLTAVTVMMLEVEAADTETLSARISDELEIANDVELRLALIRILENLSTSGLIDSAK